MDLFFSGAENRLIFFVIGVVVGFLARAVIKLIKGD